MKSILIRLLVILTIPVWVPVALLLYIALGAICMVHDIIYGSYLWIRFGDKMPLASSWSWLDQLSV